MLNCMGCCLRMEGNQARSSVSNQFLTLCMNFWMPMLGKPNLSLVGVLDSEDLARMRSYPLMTSPHQWSTKECSCLQGRWKCAPQGIEATIQSCHELEELGDVFQLRAATGEHDATDELVTKSRTSDFVVHVLDDFSHPSFDDLRKRLQRDFLGLASGQSWNANNLVGLGFLRKGRAKFPLELFRLALHDLASLADVIADRISPKRNDRRVANDAILENGNVGGAATDVHQRNPSLFFFFRKHGSGRSKGFQMSWSTSSPALRMHL